MDNLRLILLGIGIVILAVIVLLHKPATKRSSSTGVARPRREPGLGVDAAHDVDEHDRSATQEPQLEAEQGEPASHASAERAPQMDSAALAEADEIITIYMRCRAEGGMSGQQLCDAADKVGLSFGEMNVFHRRLEGHTQPIFSVANLAQPGTFDADAWDQFSGPGLTLFAALPGPQSGLATWDAMLAMAERLAELLEGEVLDDARCLMTRQRIGQMREAMREFDRRHGLSRPSTGH